MTAPANTFRDEVLAVLRAATLTDVNQRIDRILEWIGDELPDLTQTPCVWVGVDDPGATGFARARDVWEGVLTCSIIVWVAARGDRRQALDRARDLLSLVKRAILAQPGLGAGLGVVAGTIIFGSPTEFTDADGSPQILGLGAVMSATTHLTGANT